MTLTVKHLNKYTNELETLRVIFTTYPGGNTRINLVAESGEPYATLTTNPDWKIPADEGYIKNYGENAGLLKTLIEAGILEHTGKWQVINEWGTQADICKIVKREAPEPVKAKTEELHIWADLSTLSANDLQTVINWLTLRGVDAQNHAAMETMSIDSHKPGMYDEDDIANVIDTGIGQGRIDELDEAIREAQVALNAKK